MISSSFGDADRSRVVELPALLDRDHAVAIAGNHQQRALDPRDALARGIAIAHQPSHRQDRIVHPAHVDHRRERRPQHERRRRMLRGQRHGYASAQRFAEIRDAFAIDAGTSDNMRSRGPRIFLQSAFGGRPGILAIASVIEQQHRMTTSLERGRERRDSCDCRRCR